MIVDKAKLQKLTDDELIESHMDILIRVIRSAALKDGEAYDHYTAIEAEIDEECTRRGLNDDNALALSA